MSTILKEKKIDAFDERMFSSLYLISFAHDLLFFSRCHLFFFVSSFLHSTYIDYGNKLQKTLFPTTTDPPQVTVKLWLPLPPSSPFEPVM